MIRLLIVADIRLYREGLAQLLAEGEQFEIVKTAAHVDAAMDGVRNLDLDVVLLDMMTPEALTAVRAIVQLTPHVKVVAVGVPESESEVIACAEAGVSGYVLREGSVEDLVAAITSAWRGELRCSPKMAGSLLRHVATLATERDAEPVNLRLTRREHEIACLIEEGLTNKEIAVRLFVEVATVKNHVHNILEKFQVKTRGEAAALVRRRGWHAGANRSAERHRRNRQGA